MREETELSGQLLSNLDYSLELQVLLLFEMLISCLSRFWFFNCLVYLSLLKLQVNGILLHRITVLSRP